MVMFVCSSYYSAIEVLIAVGLTMVSSYLPFIMCLCDFKVLFVLYSNRSNIKAIWLICGDVTIIEWEIEIEFFLENRIESKSIFWLVFVIDFDSGYIGKDNALQRVQRMTFRAAES